ncbi:hypothetical protein BsWGS_00434 [Bradybaena similaris]
MSGHTGVTVPESMTEPGDCRRRVGAVVEDVSHHLDCLSHGGCGDDRSTPQSATQDLAVPSVGEASLDENSNRLSSFCVIVKEVGIQYREYDEYPKEVSKKFSENSSRQHEHPEERSRQREYSQESRRQFSEESRRQFSEESTRQHEYSEVSKRGYSEQISKHGYSEQISKHGYSEEGSRQHGYPEEGSRQEHSEEGSKHHEYPEEGSRHEHSEEGSKRHEYSEEGSRHEHSEEGSRHENSEDGSRHENSEDSSRHEHSEEGSKHNEYPEEGSRHHESSEEGSRQHEYPEKGSKHHEYPEEGSRHHEYLEEGSRQHEYSEEGSRYHEYLEEGSSQHEYSKESSRHHEYPEEGSRHHVYPEEGSRQHEYPEEGSRQEIPEEGDGDHSGNISISDMDTLMNPPDEELKQKVISLVEFYFSDESILKDAFLLKHVRRNRFGFVSLKLITSFKKMKALTRDYNVVAYCLKASEKLELNEESTKVRRKDPLPDYDETVPSRTVVALNLPLENPTMENMAEIFSKCGCVNNFRILRPGSSIPSDLHKFASKHPELESTMCAVVAFENYDQAQKACEILTNGDDWRKGMRVIPLMVPKKKEDKDKEQKDMKKKEGTGKDDISPEDYSADDKKRRRRGGRRKKACVGDVTQDSFTCSNGSQGDSLSKFTVMSANKFIDENVICVNMINPAGSSYSVQPINAKPFLLDSHASLISQSSSEIVRQNANSSAGDSAPSGPWMQRRLRVNQEKLPGCNPHLGRRNSDVSVISRLTPRMLDMTNVLRQPRGPDDTKGFYGGMGRGQPRSSTIL